MNGLADLVRAALPRGAVAAVRPGPPAGRAHRLTLEGPGGALTEAVLKPASAREAALYRDGLDPAATGAPALLGSTHRAGQAWLVLEALPEAHPDPGDPAEVARVYRHLGVLHRTHLEPPPAASLPGSPWLLAPGEISKVLTALPETRALAAEAAAALQTPAPVTLVHGDFHRWNQVWQGERLRLIDWEHAARAHPVWDLVMLAPEEPGWDGIPRGPLASVALRAYHEAGPLRTLPWPAFLRLQRLARLFVAARWVLTHGARAAEAPPGVAAVMREYAAGERSRVAALVARLQET
jgi:hypothetical protein